MLHPTDASLIGLYPMSTQTNVSVVCDGKTKLYLTRALLLTVQNSSHCKEVPPPPPKKNKERENSWVLS